MLDWKRTERRIAALLGEERVPVTGRGRGDVPDIMHPTLSIEVKHRQLLPAWLTDAMAQTQAAQRDDQTAIVVLHEGGRRHADALVVLGLGDFCRLHGGVE